MTKLLLKTIFDYQTLLVESRRPEGALITLSALSAVFRKVFAEVFVGIIP